MRWQRIVSRGVSEMCTLLRPRTPTPGLRILLYHSVGTQLPFDQYGMCISSSLFRCHMEALKQIARVRLVPLDASVLDPQGERLVTVTFDDGYRDNLLFVAPLLVELRIPFTVFITPNLIDSGEPWYLTRRQLKELAAMPSCTIGSHGMTPQPLTQLDDQALQHELRTSRRWLEDQLGRSVTMLAYPHGGLSRRVRDAVEDAGYTLAVCSRNWVNDCYSDPLALFRTEILGCDSLRVFQQKLVGGWDWLRFKPDALVSESDAYSHDGWTSLKGRKERLVALRVDRRSIAAEPSVSGTGRSGQAGVRPWVVSLLRCPVCRGAVALFPTTWHAPHDGVQAAPAPRCIGPHAGVSFLNHPRRCELCEGYEVTSGTLRCQRCERVYRVEHGVANLLAPWPKEAFGAAFTARTALSYGYLWEHHPRWTPADLVDAHFEQVRQTLQLMELQGLVLDAGCGGGVDLLWMASCDGVNVIGLELSHGGCLASQAQIRGRPNAHVFQGDVARMPFADGQFDFVYSYGVLHHLADTEAGMRELVRVTKPGGRVAIYLYEDFVEREAIWRWLLTLTNSLRTVTVCLPRPLLYALCLAVAPMMFVGFTLPHRFLRVFTATRAFAQTIPFRHALSPFNLVADLYDRFATPIERRFTRDEALALCARGGLSALSIARARGWMVTGTKPAG